MLFTNSCATLHNYQNTFIDISEFRVDLILIKHINKVYELRWEPQGPTNSTSSLRIQF